MNACHNLDEIAGLSQRGQTLSIVDLVSANTLTAEMAAYGLYAMAHGASVLTAAMPGNAGKTTLLACLLAGISARSRIVTISSDALLARFDGRPATPEVMLIHEIGSGPWYGYLWGKHVSRAFELIQPNRALASCIHADTLDQLYGILTSDELGVPETDLTKMDLICFMHLDRMDNTYRRRVVTMYEAFGDATEHRLLFRWNPDDDRFARIDDASFLSRLAAISGKSTTEIRGDITRYQQFIEALQRDGVNDFRQVRLKLLESLVL